MTPVLRLLTVIVVLVGCLPPLQAGVNATIARYWGHPLLAALTNTLVASAVLALAALVLRVPAPSTRLLAAAPWWSWIGGVFGATLVISAIVLARRLGAAAYVSAMIVGTMSASLAIDHLGLVGFAEHQASPLRLLGGALVITGMVLVQRY